jgi:hypothetical protein
MELHHIFLKYKALLINLIFLPDSSEKKYTFVS